VIDGAAHLRPALRIPLAHSAAHDGGDDRARVYDNSDVTNERRASASLAAILLRARSRRTTQHKTMSGPRLRALSLASRAANR
jgi:hypothetical protein